MSKASVWVDASAASLPAQSCFATHLLYQDCAKTTTLFVKRTTKEAKTIIAGSRPGLLSVLEEGSIRSRKHQLSSDVLLAFLVPLFPNPATLSSAAIDFISALT
jgi:hypothetical protein